MKKLVLIAVWAAIITVFLAFNYLLWERENPQSTDTVKSPVKDTVSELNTAIQRLEDSNLKLQKENEMINAYNNQNLEQIRMKNNVIYQLKQMADLTPLVEIVKLWVKSVNDKEFKKAFKLFSNSMVYQKEYTIRMRDYFKNYDALIKSIKTESIELDFEHTEKGKNGEIIFKVLLDIKHFDSGKRAEFKEGLNTRYFIMTYDDITEDWFISGILIEP